ncbi:MAG: transporter [Phycisphaerales bacterium]|nr:transporter [Phycisphaerales bacterium]
MNRTCTAALCAMAACAGARAQEAMSTEAATQPSAGAWYIKQQLRFSRSTTDPVGFDRDIDELRALTSVYYGLDTDLALGLILPFVYRDIDSPQPGVSEDVFGLDDFTLRLKWRFWRKDTGPIDTARLSLIADLEIPSGDNDLSSKSLDPGLALAYTMIRGRHGLSADLGFKFNASGGDVGISPGDTGANALRYDAAYLFRLAPAQYAQDTHGAWYAALECNGLYEVSGDNEVFLAPGLMYEGRSWALEASVQLPVWQDIDHRPERDFVVILGLRLFF